MLSDTSRMEIPWRGSSLRRPCASAVPGEGLDFPAKVATLAPCRDCRLMREKAVTHFFAIALCFSMVGMSLMPGGLVPCCCKLSHNGSCAQKVLGCCGSGVAAKTDSGGSVHARMCCSTDRVPGHSCCSDRPSVPKPRCKTMKKSCPVCHCGQETPMVTLSGYVNPHSLIRVPVVASVQVVAPETPSTGLYTESVTRTDSSGPAIALQTCVFRC